MPQPKSAIRPVGRLVLFLLSLSSLAPLSYAQVDTRDVSKDPSVRVFAFDFSSSFGELTYLDSERLVISTSESELVTFNPDEIAFVQLDRPGVGLSPATAYPGRLWLTDGSYYSTQPGFDRGGLIWKNEFVGQVDASLDEIMAYNSDSTRFPGSAEHEDLVVLENGDKIDGLVDRIDRELFIEQADGALDAIPLDRVDSFTLLNEWVPQSGARLWSTDGNKISLDSFRYDQGFGLIFGEPRIHVPRISGQVMAFVYNVERLTPLARIPPKLSGIEGQERYHNPAPVIQEGNWALDAPPILISGPIRLEWSLPRTDLGLIATAVLPPSSRRHGSVELIVSDDYGILLRQVIDAEEPVCDIRIRIRGRRLKMEINENGDGPLQDSIRLDQALLLDSDSTD